MIEFATTEELIRELQKREDLEFVAVIHQENNGGTTDINLCYSHHLRYRKARYWLSRGVQFLDVCGSDSTTTY